MKSRVVRLLLLGAVAVFAAAWLAYSESRRGGWPAASHVARYERHQPMAPVFTDAQFNAFLEKARQAESMTDSLQRCLAYPDPPGLSWSSEVAAAYCHYMLDPVITPENLRQLIETGHARELDSRLAEIMRAQLSRQDSQGALDRTLRASFRNGSMETRALVDAWLRQSPQSAFALTASGMVYAQMAELRRGGDWIQNASADSLLSMGRLLDLADSDLALAVKKEPSLITAYDTMIYVGGLGGRGEGGRRYARAAAVKALEIDPSNYSVYASLVWLDQPKWGGSVDQMRNDVASAQKQSARNPLMRLLLSQRSGGEAVVDDCLCSPADEMNIYRDLFQETSPAFLLEHAGSASRERQAVKLSVVYRSEVLRFNPTHLDVRAARDFELVHFNQIEWALSEGDALVALRPQNESGYEIRGSAYRFLNDATHARPDLEEALRIHPDQSWAWVELGYLAIESEHDWDRGWEISNRLIRSWPDEPDGWILRAMVQKGQPRDGLNQTISEFQTRFGRDPARKPLVDRVKAMGNS